MQDKKLLMESFLKVAEEDNEKFLRRLRDRTDRVGIEIPKIEVRYEHVSVEGDVYVGSRALPTLLNVTLNTIEDDPTSGSSRCRENNLVARTCRETRQGSEGVWESHLLWS
ncbi:hypothetical protein ACB094_03G072200 [Castanea mollissima]